MCKNKYNCLKTENSWLKIKTKHQYLRHLILMYKTCGRYFCNHEVKVGKSLLKKKPENDGKYEGKGWHQVADGWS